MKREKGYYWVIKAKLKIIAEWTGECWFIVYSTRTFIDSDFDSINETKICNP